MNLCSVSGPRFNWSRLAMMALVVSLASPTSAWAANNPVPFIENPVSPAAVIPGNPGFTMRIHGTGFATNAVVQWNNAALTTTVVNGQQLSATVPGTLLTTATTATITVSNPAPGGGTSNPIFFPVSKHTKTVVMPGAHTSVLEFTNGAVTGDFNHDGKVDNAVVGYAHVWVSLGNGNGTFQAPVGYAAPSGDFLQAIAAADFNGDGNLDLMIGGFLNGSIGAVYVLLGNADGTFQAPTPTIPLGGVLPQAIAAGDLNNDGKLDVVIGAMDGSAIAVLLGNGDGSFAAPVNYSTDNGPISVALADFNGDGILDIAASAMFGTNVSVLLGHGDGTFGTASKLPLTLLYGQGLATGDFNRDGHLDIAVVTGFGVAVYLGNGDGTFGPPAGYGSGGNPNYNSLVVGDFNGDGRLDLVLPSTTGDISVLLGNGDGTFPTAILLPVVVSNAISQPVAVATGDFNGDGLLDVVAALGSDGFFTMLQSTIQLAPSSLSFPKQLEGTTSSPMNIRVTNFGASTVALGAVTISGFNAADFSVQNKCGTSVAPLTTCLLSVTFSPSAAGFRTTLLSVVNASIGLTQTVNLSGTGSSLVLTPSSLNFGSVTVGHTSSPQTVTLQNVGSTAVQITRVVFSGQQASDFAQTNTCGSSLAGGASCTFSITFTPTATGARSSLLLIDNTSGLSPVTVQVAGTGS